MVCRSNIYSSPTICQASCYGERAGKQKRGLSGLSADFPFVGRSGRLGDSESQALPMKAQMVHVQGARCIPDLRIHWENILLYFFK